MTAGCGLFAIDPLNKNKKVQIPLENITTTAIGEGTTLTFTVNQTFRNIQNPDAVEIEAIYAFPIDDNASIISLVIEVGDTVIEAQLKEKEKAQNEYDDAISSGHGAYLMTGSSYDSDIRVISIGRLLPNASCRVTMTCVVPIKSVSSDQYQIYIPTAVAPRYGSSDVIIHGSEIEDGHDMVLCMSGTTFETISKIESLNHPELCVSFVDNRWKVETAREKLIKTGKDIMIDIYVKSPTDTSNVLILQQDPKTKTRCAAELSLFIHPSMIKHPNMIKHSKTLREKEYIFVVDCSGSMGGARITQTRNALEIFIKSLVSPCYVNIIRFGSDFDLCYKTSQLYTEKTAKELIKYVNSTLANMGGTELRGVIDYLWKKCPSNERERVVFLLTDGEVYDTDNLIFMCEKNKANNVSRVFSIGLGNQCSHHLLDGLARATGGKAEYIVRESEIDKIVMRQLKRSKDNYLKNVSLEWSNATLEISSPAILPSLFIGERISIYALLNIPEKTNNSNTCIYAFLKVEDNTGASYVFPASCYQSQNRAEGGSVYALACKKVIDDLESVSADKNKIIDYSIRSGVLCKHTAFVGVEKRTNPTTLNMESRYIPVGKQKSSNNYGLEGGMRSPVFSLCSTLSLVDCEEDYDEDCDEDGDEDGEVDDMDIQQSMNILRQEDLVPKSAKSNMAKSIITEDILTEIIRLQNFNGSWSFSEKLALLMNITRADMIPLTSLSNLNITVIVLKFIENEFQDRKDVWELVYEKASSYVKNNSNNNNNA